ncbi:MAG: LptF/LptG family permease, partial [Planctomycetota bacterium]
LANQELVLPRLAPLLIRSHHDIGQQGAEAFDVRFTSDGRGNLLQAPSFDPTTDTLKMPTFLDRDDAGRTVRRITADQATWDKSAQAWILVGGRAITPQSSAAGTTAVLRGQPVDRYATDLGPDVLKMRRYREYATMLSISQIGQMLQSPGVVDEDALVRFALARFSTVLINMVVLVMALPFFLLRQPASLLRNSLLCAGTAIPAIARDGAGAGDDVHGVADQDLGACADMGEVGWVVSTHPPSRVGCTAPTLRLRRAGHDPGGDERGSDGEGRGGDQGPGP